MQNFIIYSIIILIVSFLFFIYNKKKKVFLLVSINIFTFMIILISLISILKLNIYIFSAVCIFIYIIGLNTLNYLISKNEVIKNNYLKFNLIFYFASSLWFFLLSFIILIFGILTDTPGL